MSISSPLVVTVSTAEGCEPGCVPKECKITLSLANMVTLKSTAKIINVFFIITIFIVANLDSLESSHKKKWRSKNVHFISP